MGLPADILVAEAALPSPVPWPSGTAPTPAPLANAPPETSDLSQFKGYDAVAATWTAAEASAMAALFTPGYPTADWYEYRHNVASYEPLVTGARAPFNQSGADMTRYYHSLGLYFPCTIAGRRVLLFKSGLHLDYDGPQCPVRKLMAEIAQAVEPKVFITTGTGGGIGADVKLGDVVVAGAVKFDCKALFKSEPWATASYTPSPLPAGRARRPDAGADGRERVVHFRRQGDAADLFVAGGHRGDDRCLRLRRFLGPLRPSGARPRLRHGRRDGRERPAIVRIHVLVFDPKRLGPPDSESRQRHCRGEQAGGGHPARYGGLTTAASLIATWAIFQAGTHSSGSTKPSAISAGYKLGRLPPEKRGRYPLS
jgi:hypothetical protein